MTNSISPSSDNNEPDQTVSFSEASQLLNSEIKQLEASLENLPVDRMPCVKLRLELDKIREKVVNLAQSKGLKLDSVAEYERLLVLRDRLKVVTLDRYIKLIPKNENVTPFITYYDLYRNRIADTPEQKHILKNLYKCAVSVLFSHPNFQPKLLQMLSEEVQLFIC